MNDIQPQWFVGADKAVRISSDLTNLMQGEYDCNKTEHCHDKGRVSDDFDK
jgi:hypothetical protein